MMLFKSGDLCKSPLGARTGQAAAAAAAATCMRACVAARVIDTIYQLIYSSAQTRAWRIEFSYRDIRDYWGRLKGRGRGAAARTRPFDRPQ